MSNFKHSLFRTLLYAQLFAGFSGAVAASQMDLSSASSPEVNQQGDKIITGKITDAKGEPIIGANVLVKGSTTGTITDIDGNFSLNVPANAILQVSYIGYVTQEVPVGNKDKFVIAIHEDTQNLDEVVVVGYGSQKKVNLTGAVEQVTSDVFDGRPTANATQMLEGVVPNLNISLADGKPGRTADFNVRGTGSINGGSALVLIDGVEGDPSMLNPNDIESVSVLKDAAASAIYGARAPFGVVLIVRCRINHHEERHGGKAESDVVFQLLAAISAERAGRGL